MITPEQACEIIMHKFPNRTVDEFTETPEYYLYSPESGMHDDRWRIDKKSGMMDEFDLVELLEYLRRYPDDMEFKEHKISDLLKAR